MALTVTPAELTATALTLTTAAQPNITSVGTLTTLTVDDITINGSTISDAADLTLDVAGDIILDAAGADVRFHNAGTLHGRITNDNNGLWFISDISDKDIYIRGNDGGSMVTALTFDMSEGGHATFVSNVTAGKFLAATASTTDAVLKLTDTGVADYEFTFPDTGTIQLGTSTSSNKELKLLNAGSGMFGLNVEGHILPAVNNNYSLGSSSARYYQVWAGTNMISPTYIATGNVTTGGYQLTDTSGNGKPAITSDANNWTIIRPLASGADVAINNYANSANLVIFTDEGKVGIGVTPSASWDANIDCLQVGEQSSIWAGDTDYTDATWIGTNVYQTGGTTKYLTTGVASVYGQQNGNHYWYGYSSGSADATVSGNEVMKISSDGAVTKPLQPCAGVSSADQSLPANLTTLIFNSERFDQSGDFDTSTYKFNAPVTGKYLVSVNLYLKFLDNAAAYYQLYIVSDNKTYYSIADLEDVGLPNGDPTYWDMTWSAVIDMDASDKVYFRMNQSGGAAQTVMDGQSYASFVLVA